MKQGDNRQFPPRRLVPPCSGQKAVLQRWHSCILLPAGPAGCIKKCSEEKSLLLPRTLSNWFSQGIDQTQPLHFIERSRTRIRIPLPQLPCTGHFLLLPFKHPVERSISVPTLSPPPPLPNPKSPNLSTRYLAVPPVACG